MEKQKRVLVADINCISVKSAVKLDVLISFVTTVHAKTLIHKSVIDVAVS